MTFLTLPSAAKAIAELLQPHDHIAQNDIERAYTRALVTAVVAGELMGQDRTTYLQIYPGDSGIAVRAVLSMVRVSELNRWLVSMGVPVTLAEDLASGGRNPARAGENTEARRDRLMRRRDELKAAGIRDFNVRLAAEEGVSISRIQQDLKQRSSAGRLDSWLLHSPSGKR